MRFDDRLATVLAQPVAKGMMANAQFAQLIDLVAQREDAAHVPQSLGAAMDRIAALQPLVPVRSRAAAVAGIGKKLRSARLTALLAQDDYAVAGLAMRAAHLGDDEWARLIPDLPVRARGLLRNRQDMGPMALQVLDQFALGDRALPSAAVQDVVTIAKAEAQPALPARSEIGHIVDRIEAFRKSRSTPPLAQTVLELALEDGTCAPDAALPDVIAFETDRTGAIAWVDSDAAHGLIGLSLTLVSADWIDPRTRMAFGVSRTVRGGQLTLDAPPVLAGRWRMDATPSFDIVTGQCRGHHGVLRRISAPTMAAAPSATTAPMDRQMHDSLRQIIHELRTPLNVISGFSEIIESQLFGPASFAYRTLAEDIGRDSRQLLDQVNDLDAAFRLGPGQSNEGEGASDAAALLNELTNAHRPGFEARQARLLLVPMAAAPVWSISRPALHWALDRLLSVLCRAAGQGDAISLVALADPSADDTAQLVVALPQAMAALPADALFSATHDFSTPGCDNGIPGAGFTLRMIANLLESWGGGLVRVDQHLVLTFAVAADASRELVMASA